MTEIRLLSSIQPVVGKTYLTNDGSKLKCIYQLEKYRFVFTQINCHDKECLYQWCSDNTGSFGNGLYLSKEIGAYEDFKIDEPVMVKLFEGKVWEKRYFAGVDQGGRPRTWSDGKTKWSARGFQSLP